MHHMHAFVDIFVDSALMEQVVEELSKISNVEEIYEVTGEFDIVTIVSAENIEDFGETLKNKIMKIPGVKSTISSIILQALKGPECKE